MFLKTAESEISYMDGDVHYADVVNFVSSGYVNFLNIRTWVDRHNNIVLKIKHDINLSFINSNVYVINSFIPFPRSKLNSRLNVVKNYETRGYF